MSLKALSLTFIVFTFSLCSITAQQKRDIAFTIVDVPPRYPGCKGANADFLKECFRNNVEGSLAENFDFRKFEDILPKGIHRVFVQFRILENGQYDQLEIRSPSQAVKTETRQVLDKLPVFEPAIHNNETRNTLFATAFTIEIKKGKTILKDTSAASQMRPRYSKVDY